MDPCRRYRVILLIFIFIHLFLCVYIHYIVSSFKALFFYTTHRPVPLLCQLFKAPIFFKKINIFIFTRVSPALTRVLTPQLQRHLPLIASFVHATHHPPPTLILVHMEDKPRKLFFYTYF